MGDRLGIHGAVDILLHILLIRKLDFPGFNWTYPFLFQRLSEDQAIKA